MDFDAVVDLLSSRSGPCLIAIDGLPVSGKSTLATRLEDELGATTLYLDDFVADPATWRGIAEPGFPFPYFRYDAFMAAVRALAAGRTARFWPLDWSTSAIAPEEREIQPGGLIVVEGVSSLHPDLAPLYDLRFWVESDAGSTLSASLARGVGDWEAAWRDLFMPSVDLYLRTDPRSRADHVVLGRGAGASSLL